MLPRRAALPETSPLMWIDWFLLALLTAWGLAWLLPGLDHPSIHNWDEAFHQAVTRGTADTFFAPHVLKEPFYPLNLRQWWDGGIWMHKAVGVFWWGAAMVKLFGVHPVALRSASLLGELALAWLTFLMIRPLAGRALGFFASASFLIIPWGWTMVQGKFVADVTDIAVSAFVALGMAWLWLAVERDSDRWAAAAGVAIGVAYLCKTFLSLAPLGVAGAWWGLSLLGLCRGPRLRQVLLMFGLAVVVAAPWNLYAWHSWPDVYVRAFDHTIGFLDVRSGEDIAPGIRPPDAIFNEINYFILSPIPYPLTALCGLWLAYQAVRKRDGREVAMALWLWSTWLVHSYSAVKGHAHLWNVMPAVFVAYAVTLRDAFKNPALAVAVIVSLLVWEVRPVLPMVPAIKRALPDFMSQTKTWDQSNFIEQLLLVVPAAFAVALAALALRKKPRLVRALTLSTASLAALGLFVFAIPRAASATVDKREKSARDDQWDMTQDVGIALDGAVEQKAVVFFRDSYDYGTNFEWLNMMFWSGRMTYRRGPDVAAAQAHGYHPYFISPAAEPYEPLAAVPAFSQLRAYDVLKPAPEATPLPDGLRPLSGAAPNYDLLGWAARELTRRFSRYVFYVHPKGPLSDLHVTFLLDDGRQEALPLELRGTLELPPLLQTKAWFILSAIGPPLDHVKDVRVSP